MALKMVVRTLDGMDEAVKKFYTPAKVPFTENGKETEIDAFVLDVEGVEEHPSTGALHRAKQREKQRAQEAEESARKLKMELQTFKDQEHERLRGTRPKDEVDALEKSYLDKIKTIEGERDQLRSGLHGHLIDGAARTLATEIAVDTDAIPALLPHILPRLRVEMQGEKPVTRIVDGEGKPTALSMDDLRKDLLASKPLARLVSGTKAKGGGASGSESRGSAPAKVDFSKSPREIAAALKAADTNPESEE